jgi:hypothetical protein
VSEFVTRRRDVVFRQLDDEWVVYDPTGDKIHSLNLTAALVWTNLTGELDVEGVFSAVAESFGDPGSFEDVRGDIERAIGRFRDEGLIE